MGAGGCGWRAGLGVGLELGQPSCRGAGLGDSTHTMTSNFYLFPSHTRRRFNTPIIGIKIGIKLMVNIMISLTDIRMVIC